jgi:hypothetical protein
MALSTNSVLITGVPAKWNTIELKAELDNHPDRTLREAATVIEKISGLKRSLPQVRLF